MNGVKTPFIEEPVSRNGKCAFVPDKNGVKTPFIEEENMNLNLATESVSLLTVFIQGLLSFFSPCVLPLLPVYIGYLSGGTMKVCEDGKRVYDRRKAAVNTCFFVLGIGFAFLALGLGARAAGAFFSGNRRLFAGLGGVLVILFGLYQLVFSGTGSFLARELRLPLRLDRMAMSPVTAFLMGFAFSFSWTPCVGPTLSSILLMAASAARSEAGFALIGVYTLGFALPFLLAGLFTSSVLAFFQKHRDIVRHTAKAGGVLLVLMGVLMLTGGMDRLSGVLAAQGGGTAAASAAAEADAEEVAAAEAGTGEKAASGAEGTEQRGPGSEGAEQGEVTVAENGVVYHTDPNCVYLRPRVRAVSASSLRRSMICFTVFRLACIRASY